jgi:hypothetical protein
MIKKWNDLSNDQKKAIKSFSPPKYYIWFYKIYNKYLSSLLFFSIISAGILMIIHNIIDIDLFNIVKGFFFFCFSIVIWAFSAYIVKHLYTKKYSKSIGLSIKEWNSVTSGMVFEF